MRAEGLLIVMACTFGFGCNSILGVTDIKSGRVIDASTIVDTRVCNAGTPCEPANQCHTGVTTCSQQGDVSCVDTGTAVMDGTACAAGTCTGGACSDPCGTVACDQPPASTCTGSVLTTYANPGTCNSSTGSPVCSYAPSTTDCAANGQICGANQCEGIPDAAPPPIDG